jgi:hypothetical protein
MDSPRFLGVLRSFRMTFPRRRRRAAAAARRRRRDFDLDLVLAVAAVVVDDVSASSTTPPISAPFKPADPADESQTTIEVAFFQKDRSRRRAFCVSFFFSLSIKSATTTLVPTARGTFVVAVPVVQLVGWWRCSHNTDATESELSRSSRVLAPSNAQRTSPWAMPILFPHTTRWHV